MIQRGGILEFFRGKIVIRFRDFLLAQSLQLVFNGRRNVFGVQERGIFPQERRGQRRPKAT